MDRASPNCANRDPKRKLPELFGIKGEKGLSVPQLSLDRIKGLGRKPFATDLSPNKGRSLQSQDRTRRHVSNQGADNVASSPVATAPTPQIRWPKPLRRKA